MKREKWQRILAARTLLGLKDTASVREIKNAYRRLAQTRHPDLATDGAGHSGMQELNAAYSILLEHCTTYPIPLSPPTNSPESMEPEDWWLDRFGEDPLWGRKREKQ